jgi:uncharacterized protein YaeQ
MALTATMYHVTVTLSDVDRNVYTQLDLRLARHPSESLRYLATRLMAYCLSYEEGMSFSRGGLSTPDEAPIEVRDATGALEAWIDIGSPSAERLHKAAKAAARVALYTCADLAALRRDVAKNTVFRAADIDVWCLAPEFVAVVEECLTRTTNLELVRTEGHLYVTVGDRSFAGTLSHESLVPAAGPDLAGPDLD